VPSGVAWLPASEDLRLQVRASPGARATLILADGSTLPLVEEPATDDVPAGIGVTALHAFGSANYYFTPGSLASVYAGAGYWAQITARDGPDNGSVLGLGGFEAALSSRATVYVEGGYGFALTQTDGGATRQRFVARIGVRVKL